MLIALMLLLLFDSFSNRFVFVCVCVDPNDKLQKNFPIFVIASMNGTDSSSKFQFNQTSTNDEQCCLTNLFEHSRMFPLYDNAIALIFHILFSLIHVHDEFTIYTDTQTTCLFFTLENYKFGVLFELEFTYIASYTQQNVSTLQ